ncbi:hypothetical protein SKAU_G00421310 [Synaphobranchus kaupii]|uniref:Uncharacterized protein n=1 Tax=Synaphobranchus kaupii TaxID=118154 RepID=A0A9Q1E6X0_SYNKA|nr:hypothetical protein SKAU_G00421310 [Synaphobranchus kaupii]
MFAAAQISADHIPEEYCDWSPRCIAKPRNFPGNRLSNRVPSMPCSTITLILFPVATITTTSGKRCEWIFEENRDLIAGGPLHRPYYWGS